MSERGDGLQDGLDAGALGSATIGELLSTVRRFHDIAMLWHTEEPAESPDRHGTAAKALHLHELNFALWHHEDAVRRRGAGDREVARRKRCIDDVNARRNGAIEIVDADLLNRIELNPNAPLHTETPGTIVDRLSVLALRIVHTNPSDARLVVLDEQYGDLFRGLEQFLASIQAGQATFKLYRQFKSAAPRNYCDLFEGRDA